MAGVGSGWTVVGGLWIFCSVVGTVVTANVVLVLYATMLLEYAAEVPAEEAWLLETMESTELVETEGTELIGTEVIELESAVADPLLAAATSSSSK